MRESRESVPEATGGKTCLPVPPMEKQWGLYTGRLQRFMTRDDSFYTDMNLGGTLIKRTWQEGVKIEVSSPADQPKFETAINMEFQPTNVGADFGPAWSTHWFRISLPKVESVTDNTCFHWESDAEGLLWSSDGRALHGLSNKDRSDVPYSLISPKGEPVVIYIELACNGLFGNGAGGMINPPDENRRYRLNSCELREYDPQSIKLHLSMQILHDLINTYGADSNIGRPALFVANRVMNTFHHDNQQASIQECLKITQEFFASGGGNINFEVFAVGNCHIDTAWLWRFRETRRKTARSWSSQLAILDVTQPAYKFVAPQMQQLSWLREDYPELFERIIKAVKKGSFVPIGGSWVEMDGNMPGGESFVRQFLYGQRFQKKHFGEYTNIFWLPDTFGYNAQLPQLMLMAGMKYFVTQKLSWNNINRFPHTSFWWEGLDGTRVLTHFPPANTYASGATSGDVIKSERDHKEIERATSSLLLYGHGDGGGGPTYEMVQRLELMMSGDLGKGKGKEKNNKESGSIASLPTVSFSTPERFFAKLEKEATDLLTWRGELYFELHRGTYTSHARTKFYNRRCETLLKEAEMLSFVLGVVSSDLPKYYPNAELEELWKGVLLNQFHDVLPGSSIGDVYRDSTKIYEHVEYHAALIRDNAMDALFGNKVRASARGKRDQELSEVASKKAQRGKGIVLFNTTPYKRDEVLIVPWDGSDESDTPQPGVIAVADVEGFSMASFEQKRIEPPSGGDVLSKKFAKVQAMEAGGSSGKPHYIMENSFVRVHIDETGHVISYWDKEAGREIIERGAKANRFVLYEDIPFFWDAWDVELYHLEKGRCVSESDVRLEIGMKGPLLVSLLRVISISPHSTIHQVISLSCVSRRLDFTCRVEWHESHQLLKVDFPLAIHTDQASFECPFGVVKRPTHRNTSWDVARFEVCGHRFADLSEPDYGVALLNNCKYGYAALKSCLSLSLLRSPKAPDPECDMGQHVMKFALFPHRGDVATGGVIGEAVKFNTELLWTAASPKLYDDRWLGKSVLQFHWAKAGPGDPHDGFKFDNCMREGPQGECCSCVIAPIAIETVKMAEDSMKEVIIRAYEPRGCRGVARLQAHTLLCMVDVRPCDLLERDLDAGTQAPRVWREEGSDDWLISFLPFQVISLRATITLAPDATPPHKGAISAVGLYTDRASVGSFEIVE